MPKLVLPDAKQIQTIVRQTQELRLKDEPLKWVMYAFPWGKPNTPLADRTGPYEWQVTELLAVAEFIRENKRRIAEGKDSLTYKCAVSSGRGIGKSTLVAWLSLWNMTCQLGSSTIVTANTDAQLTTKTFAEIGKWQALLINDFFFERTQKKITPYPWIAESIKTAQGIDNQYWYISGGLWNEDTPDSFAGAHNECGEMYIFDEASGIPASIWKVTEGIFTERTPYKFWFCFSNPRSNQGPFYDCFNEYRAFWRTIKIDGRTVKEVSQNTYEQIIKKYGENSRDAMVEVRGEFPEHGDKQFISRAAVDLATRRQLERYDDHAALRMGVDPARYGDDSTVIRFRRGRDARSIPPIVMRGADNMQVANKCAELIEKFNPDGVFVDSGAGAGIIDRLKEMGYQVFEVMFGSAAQDSNFYDHRTELWARMRDWLGGAMIGCELEEDRKLMEDFVGPEWETMGREEKIKLESKEKMKARSKHNKSPDNADALAVTFHCEISRKDLGASRKSIYSNRRRARGVGSDVNFG